MFHHLDQPKKEKILNAAFEEFSLYSYQNASTNRIVKKAGIAKGMLFSYFNNKKELFHDLVFMAVGYVREHYLDLIDTQGNDFIEKYRQVGVLKLKAYKEAPLIFHFLANLYVNLRKNELSEEVKHELMKLRELGFQKLHANIDTSHFRKDVPAETMHRLILWVMDGYEKELTAKFQDKNLSEVDILPHWDEFYQILDALKIIFYEGESLCLS